MASSHRRPGTGRTGRSNTQMSSRLWHKEQERKRRERMRRARNRRIFTVGVILAVLVVVLIVVLNINSDNDSAHNLNSVSTTRVSEQTAQETRMPDSTVKPAEVSVKSDFYDGAAFVGNALASGIQKYGLLTNTDFYAGNLITLDNVYNTAGSNGSMAIADQLKSKKFNKIFLCFGELELAWENSREFSDLYKEFLETVKSYQQSANIYIMSIPPVSKEASDMGMDISRIKSYNKALKSIAANEKVYYIDSFEALSRGGYLPDGVSADGINLNKEYYAKLLNYAADKSKIPDPYSEDEDEYSDDYTDDDNTDYRDDGYESSATDEPEPTVNILKDRVD